MKFIIGYQLTEDENFVRSIVENKDKIKEVYFSFGDFPNGRASVKHDSGMTLFEKQKREEKDLVTLANAGLDFNLLFNGNCYGADSLSRAFFHKIGDTVDYLRSYLSITSVTTSSPIIAKFLRENFENIDIRASVNMEIGTVEAIEYISRYFDSFYVKRECNRDRKALARLREWCLAEGKEMYLLANSGCLSHCSAHTFHDNLVSHEAEIAKMDNCYSFEGVCHSFLKDEKNREKWLSRTTFIRPEDISLYEEFTTAVKLATRVNRDPKRVLESYTAANLSGNITSILEPDHSHLFYPFVTENKKFPSDFGQKIMSCSHNCIECNYCKEVYKNARVNLGGM